MSFKKTIIKENTYQVSGMHCASCELLIEKKLITLPQVQSVEASTAKGEVVLESEGQGPTAQELTKLFAQEKYVFSQSGEPLRENGDYSLIYSVVVVLLLIMGFIVLNGSGWLSGIQVTANSSLLMFVALGVVAGLSSCAALVGGLVLSMSKQWSEVYDQKKTTLEKLTPHLLFNTGRIVSFALFGGILGLLGSRLQINPGISSFLGIGVAVLMLILGLQMLGVKYFQKFQFAMPKAVTRFTANEKNFQGKYLPMLMGAMTFFLPCGFTITAQSVALLSGDPWLGLLIMLAFVLGTTPSLMVIGFSSLKLAESNKYSHLFPKVAGALVLFFALFNLNNQLNSLGLFSLNDLSFGVKGSAQVSTLEGLAPLVDGKQLLKMDASSSGYLPNTFKVKAGVPVRWEITDKGTSGCTNAIISKSLFEGSISLTPGQVSVKEFTPEIPGKYKFSCWMGMVTGVIEVVDKDGQAVQGVINEVKTETTSGGGCGCGGSNSGVNGSCHLTNK